MSNLCVGPANSRAFGVFQRTTPVTARCTVLSFCQTPAQILAEEFPRLLSYAVFPTVLVRRITIPTALSSFLLETAQFCNHKTYGMQDAPVFFVSIFMF